MKATESLTNQQEKHKGGPILYRANDEDRSGCGATRAVSLGDLWYGLDEVTFAIVGCLDMVEEMQETNQNASLIAPLLMLRLALKFGMDRLWELSPCADKRNRDIHADKTPDGQKTIVYREFQPKKIGLQKRLNPNSQPTRCGHSAHPGWRGKFPFEPSERRQRRDNESDRIHPGEHR